MWKWFSRLAPKHRTHRARRRDVRPHLEALEDRYCPSGGSLNWSDPTANGDAIAYAVALQTDGKIVVGGDYSNGSFAIARYNPNGTLDTSFGNGGSTSLSIGRYSSHLAAIAVDGYGRIVLAGDAVNNGFTGSGDWALARLTSNGKLDQTFGNKGIVTTSFGNSKSTGPGSSFGLDAIAIQSNGDIVADGWWNNTSGMSFGALARYNSNGSLDKSFGSGGLETTYLGGGQVVFNALALQSDGKIVAGGEAAPSAAPNNFVFTVARFNANGSLDGSFGSGGVATTSIAANGDSKWYTGIFGLAIQGNGMIVGAGTVNSSSNGLAEVALTRYDTSGNLDPNFGSNGVALTPSTGNIDSAQAVALQSDGMIVTSGFHRDGVTNIFSFEVERYTSTGVLDGTFGNGGIITTQIGKNAEAYALAIQSNGDLVVAGYSTDGTSNNFALACYLPSEPQIGSFTANPNPVTSGSSTTLTASNITDANPNSTITQVTFYYYDLNGNKIVLGTGTEDSSGNWVLNFTVNLASGTYTLYAQTQDNYGVLGDPATLTLNVN